MSDAPSLAVLRFATDPRSFVIMREAASAFPPLPTPGTKSPGTPVRRRLVRLVPLCVAVTLFVTVSGCVYFPNVVHAYDGPSLPQSQIATISSYAPDYIVIIAVDGKPVPDAGPTLKRVEVDILPGQHVIECRYYTRHQRLESLAELREKIRRGLVLEENLVLYDVLPPQKIPLNAIAGHHYRVNASGDTFLLSDT